jgi:sugar/nucleoside kinase (ribokinase family)
MERRHDILGIGFALVDCFLKADQELLLEHGLEKGGSRVLDGRSFDHLLDEARKLGLAGVFPGDNARNACEAAAWLGASTTFLAAIGTDDMAEIFREAMASISVQAAYEVRPGRTGVVLAVVTPDGERSFALNMGRSDQLSMLPASWPGVFRFVYVASNTLVASSGTQQVAWRAVDAARLEGTAVAVSLENFSHIEGSSERLVALLEGGVQVLFGSDQDIASIFGPGAGGLEKARLATDLVFVKHGSAGSTVLSKEGRKWELPSFPAEVVDTTGAGDWYAGAVLARLCQGSDPGAAAAAGSWLAARVVETLGARLPPGVDVASVPGRP